MTPMRALAAAMLLLSPVAASGSDPLALCAACHSMKPGETGTGPTLFGVIGRKAGTVPGFRYSAAMRASGMVWTRQALDRFLADPQAAVPGNRMPFSGIDSASDRAAILAAIAQASANEK